jgi:hypothetical protein
MKRRCVLERRRRTFSPTWEREDIWHVLRGAHDADWAGIACSDSDGIVMPGPFETRKPTCPDCLALLVRRLPPKGAA